MAFDYTNLYPDTSGNGGYTKSWNYTTVVDSIATCNAAGYFNKVATRLGIGDNIVVAVVDAFDKTRTTLVEYGTLFVTGIAGGVVTTVNSSAAVTGASIAYVDAADALKANIASPTFTGTPAAPTATVGTNTAQIATTAFVLANAGSGSSPATVAPLMDGAAAVGTSSLYARQDHVHPSDTSRAPLASPALTGTPTAPTATAGTNTGQLATTAYVDTADALKANLASPALTGTPTAPTATAGTNTGQLATTAFVLANAGSGSSPATVAPLMDGAAAVGTSLLYARQDHVHPSDTSRAPLASPTFTGVPAAPNVAVDVSTTQIANTAFVIGQAAAATPVMDGAAAVGTSTRFARADHVHPTDTTKIATVKKQVFTASGTYTPSAGMLYATIECVGGGGGGGGAAGAASQYYCGGGGGSGGYSRTYTTAAAVGASKAVTIGPAGTGGVGSANGTSGGATSVGALCVANGGGPGLFGSNAQVAFGGDGGTAGTGDITAAGAPGASGMYSTSSTIKAANGNGGSSAFGGGGKASTANGAAANGNTASNYGGGGGGAAADATASSATGGAGSPGIVIINEYCSS